MADSNPNPFDTITVASYTPNPFNTLPIETNQHIASYLEYDTDICKFRLICRSTLDAVDADNCSFWRRRFLACFEKPIKLTNNVAFKHAYQKRKYVLKHGAQFQTGETRKEKGCLELVRDLVVESFSGKPTSSTELTYDSANLAHIKRFLLANNLLQIIFEPPKPKLSRFTSKRTLEPQNPTPLLLTIQVLCAPMLLSFEPHIANEHYGFPDSQIVVYSTPSEHPVFTGCNGLDVNMEFILHNINFWKYHMVREAEATLFYAFKELDDSDRPRWWSDQPKLGTRELGKHWKGSYAYIQREEIEAMRRGLGDVEQIQDFFAGEDEAYAFQDMQLEVTPEDADFVWPPMFEQILQARTPPQSKAKTRAQKRSATPEDIGFYKPLSFHFEGEGQDQMEEFLAAGWLNPLPPQQGVPGWQRLTMMKYFENEDTGELDIDALWAYEGVVLPGGQIVVGRWWSPTGGTDEGKYSGPFILWCVDGAKYDDVSVDDNGSAGSFKKIKES